MNNLNISTVTEHFTFEPCSYSKQSDQQSDSPYRNKNSTRIENNNIRIDSKPIDLNKKYQEYNSYYKDSEDDQRKISSKYNQTEDISTIANILPSTRRISNGDRILPNDRRDFTISIHENKNQEDKQPYYSNQNQNIQEQKKIYEKYEKSQKELNDQKYWKQEYEKAQHDLQITKSHVADQKKRVDSLKAKVEYLKNDSAQGVINKKDYSNSDRSEVNAAQVQKLELSYNEINSKCSMVEDEQEKLLNKYEMMQIEQDCLKQTK